jgi:hypothetical protein
MHCANNIWSGVWKIGSGGRILAVPVSVPLEAEVYITRWDFSSYTKLGPCSGNYALDALI